MAKNVTFSLFGEIECMVARRMMLEGKEIHELPLIQDYRDAIPHDVRFNKMGHEVRMVIVIRHNLLPEFERRIEATRL